MSRGVARQTEAAAPAAGSRLMPASLQIGEPGDSFEQEADRVADAVMGGATPHWSLSRMSAGTPLQRKCECGGSGECEECKKKGTLQRRAADSAAPSTAPSIVHEVLRTPGQPLDAPARAFFEPRLGHDFSRIRIHADSRAAESARAVNAFAFTVDNHVVMGAGMFAPQAVPGRRLLAHELVHAIQQGSAPQAASRRANAGPYVPPITGHTGAPVVARACFTKEICESKTERTPEQLMQEQTSDPANKSKRERRRAACKKKPPDATCKSDGHGARAVQAEKVLHDWDPTRLKLIKKIVVDKDIESGFGALTGDCSGFMPPIWGGGLCTFIPDKLEQESAQFNTTQDPRIGGHSRDIWRDLALEVLSHETEHARFDVTTISAPRKGACKFADIQDALSEIAAMMAEFPLRFQQVRENVALTPEQRKGFLGDWFDWRITDENQSFKSTLHSIYCACECNDAEAYLKKTIAFATASWSREEKTRFHGELQDAKWAAHDLRWPVAPPPAAVAPAAAPAGAVHP